MKSVEVNSENIKSVLDIKGIVVLDFWADWCRPCKILEPTIEDLALNNKDVSVGKVNVSDCGGIAAAYGIKSIPTIIFFKDGEEVTKLSGVQTLKTLQKVIDKLS